MGTKQEVPDIIIIDDDESARSQTQHPIHRDDAYDSDANSSGFDNCSNRQPRWQSADGFSAGNSEFSGKSYDDDCFAMQRGPMESGPSQLSWRLHTRAPKGEKRPAILRNDLKRSCSSSDCEIIEDLDGKIRQDWEKAALKKRFGNSYVGGSFRAESEESTSAVGSAARWTFLGKGKGHSQQSDSKSQKVDLHHSGSSSVPSPKDKDTTPVTLLDQQDSNHDFADMRSEDAIDSAGDETSVTDTGSLSSANNLELSEEEASCSEQDIAPIKSSSSDRMQSEDVLDRRDPEEHQVMVKAASKLSTDSLSLVRKTARESEELQFAEEEERLLFQEESQRQAEGAQRERKKRRVDAERKLGMEIRQKQRLEEIRQNQQEEERTHGYKEQVRGRIRSELEGVAASSLDMASLLRNLGVEVDGGVYPSIQQVNAAYKKALLRFHPDRVAALAKTDPFHQVEAEETFKLISKMKTTLQPVALY
ncbi:hypothetical protein GOP47_0009562 [Adiantum capillus-veneris]|uniref:J domain-containing protein n=1 Tax=Adiantum capillus-veneris TaxID=13818 RepID=A0A9D4UX17_ADICA|nr:hypothetical protein GOP47_0009562 [Adiantum capillus-veneris]